MSISRRIKETREDRGLKQDQLAHAAGVNLSTISRAERGVTVPNDEHLRAIAKALGVEPAWLEHGDAPPRGRRAPGATGLPTDDVVEAFLLAFADEITGEQADALRRAAAGLTAAGTRPTGRILRVLLDQIRADSVRPGGATPAVPDSRPVPSSRRR